MVSGKSPAGGSHTAGHVRNKVSVPEICSKAKEHRMGYGKNNYDKANFHDQKDYADKHGTSSDVYDFLLSRIAGAVNVYPSDYEDDKAGTDLWVELQNGKRISVDVKVRHDDCQNRTNRKTNKRYDDLCLELWSDVDYKRVGWTLNADKTTDFVLWHWVESNRKHLMQFRLLCLAFTQHKEEWLRKYPTHQNTTVFSKGTDRKRLVYGEVVFVPRPVVWRAIYGLSSENDQVTS